MKTSGDSQKTIVVGAGIAGLTTAFLLSQAGHHVELIEKSNRLGGRITTIDTKYGKFNLGAIIMPKWYANLKQLITELGIGYEINETNKRKAYFEINESLKPFQTLQSLPSISKLFLASLPILPRSGSIYEPTYTDENFTHWVRKTIGHNTIFEKKLDALVQLYSYLPFAHYSRNLVLSLFKKIIFQGGIITGLKLKNGLGLDDLVETIKQRLIEKGVEIHFGEELQSVDSKNKQITTSKQTYSYDNVVIATTWLEAVHGKMLNVETPLKYSHSHTLVSKSSKTFAVAGDLDWQLVALSDNVFSDDRQGLICSFRNLKGIKDKNHTFMSHYVFNATSDEHAKELVLARLIKIIPDFSVDEWVLVQEFKQNLPEHNPTIVQKIKEIQGKDDVYFVGDYMGFPLMEVASYWGRKIATMILKKQGAI